MAKRHIIVMRIEADDPNEEYTIVDFDQAVRAALHEIYPKEDLLIIPEITTSSAII